MIKNISTIKKENKYFSAFLILVFPFTSIAAQNRLNCDPEYGDKMYLNAAVLNLRSSPEIKPDNIIYRLQDDYTTVSILDEPITINGFIKVSVKCDSTIWDFSDGFTSKEVIFFEGQGYVSFDKLQHHSASTIFIEPITIGYPIDLMDNQVDYQFGLAELNSCKFDVLLLTRLVVHRAKYNDKYPNPISDYEILRLINRNLLFLDLFLKTKSHFEKNKQLAKVALNHKNMLLYCKGLYLKRLHDYYGSISCYKAVSDVFMLTDRFEHSVLFQQQDNLSSMYDRISSYYNEFYYDYLKCLVFDLSKYQESLNLINKIKSRFYGQTPVDILFLEAIAFYYSGNKTKGIQLMSKVGDMGVNEAYNYLREWN